MKDRIQLEMKLYVPACCISCFGHFAPLPLTPHKKEKRDLKIWGGGKTADFVYIKIHEHMAWPLSSRSHSVCLKGQLLMHRPGHLKKLSNYEGSNALFLEQEVCLYYIFSSLQLLFISLPNTISHISGEKKPKHHKPNNKIKQNKQKKWPLTKKKTNPKLN